MQYLSLLLAIAAAGQAPPDDAFPAHRVAGNTYYVGSKALATYLIATPEGHILINSGFEETVPLIRASVESLGFKMRDVKIILESHAHSDHVAGHALLKELTGAKVYVMRGDDQVIASGGEGQYLYTDSRWKPCAVDVVLKDGDEVKLGDATLIARLTPGHTRGCTTWTWRVADGDKKYDVVVIGSPNVNPGYRLVDNKDYPEIADDFAKTFKVLKSLPCDIFLGAHGEYYGMIAKLERVKTAKQNPFIDPAGYRDYVELKEKAFRKTLAEQTVVATATFKGVVTFNGKPPVRQLRIKKDDPKVKPNDRAICAAEDHYSEELLVNEKGGNGVANVVIYLQKVPTGYQAPPVPEEPVILDMKECRFIPHVMVLRCNQKILFKNDDSIHHNARLDPIRNSGFNQVIGANNREGVSYTLKKPEPRPFPVNGDLHPWMRAYILPLDHHFAAVTDAEGKFEIKGLPPGKHTFTVWHELPGYLKKELPIVIKADEVTEQELSFGSDDLVKPVSKPGVK